jgi:hypothetical protein
MERSGFLSLFILSFFCLCATGQTLNDAKNWYTEGRFAEALPVFQKEYLNNPNTPAVNQWLGVSLFKTGKITEAQKYLEFASERKIPEAHIYLGELYTLLYRFDDAEKEFEKYQQVKRKDKEAALEKLALKRAYAEKLRRAVNRTEDLQIIDSVVVPKLDFLAAYNLSASSGSLMPAHKFFSDRLMTDETLYINELQDKIYYSGGNAAADLYTMEKLLDAFDNEKKLPETINKTGNQAFPFVLSDGMTLYFASTDDSSFGGYDLFVTRYNLTSESYLSPNQLNMPFNSPFNDYMLAIDEEKGVGWFASDRFQPDGSVCVYTFIPNPQVQLLESGDEGYLAGRARISAIADTWKKGTDYRPLRSLARQKTVIQQEAANDFTFVINDQATYHSLSDFKNERARSLFAQALDYEKQLLTLNDELSQKRDWFADGQRNDVLTASILTLEKKSESLFRETERLRMQARNEEIRTLNQ